jgi:hypothetical protein
MQIKETDRGERQKRTDGADRERELKYEGRKTQDVDRGGRQKRQKCGDRQG